MPAYFISNHRLEQFSSLDEVESLDISTKIRFDLDGPGFLVNSRPEVDKIASNHNRTWNSSSSTYDHIRIVNFSAQNEDLPEDNILDIEVPPLDDEDLEESVSDLNVSIHENYDGHHQTTFKEIIRKSLLPVLRQNVMISVPHGFAQERFTENDFEIHIWSSSTGERNAKPPRKIWDIPVSCRDLAFTDSGVVCDKIMDGDWIVAELHKNTLYIHHDICHKGTDDEVQMFQKLIDEVASKYDTTERREELRALEYKRNLENFVSMCIKKQLGSMKKMKDAYNNYNSEIDEQRKRLSQTIEKRDELQRKIDSLEPTMEFNSKKYQSQYDQLMKLDNVTKIRFPENDKILIYTDTLYCTDPRSLLVHDIGKFKISIDMDERSVKWKNQTRLVKNAYNSEGMQAPHVFADGRPCLGNVEETFAECLAKQDFYSIAVLAIKFIQSVNTNDSAGEHVNKWPVKDETDENYKTRLAEAS